MVLVMVVPYNSGNDTDRDRDELRDDERARNEMIGTAFSEIHCRI
jgi:hypothetical protein